MSSNSDDDEWIKKGPQLDASGKLLRIEPTQNPSFEPEQPPMVIELVERPSRAARQTEWSEPAPYRDEVFKSRKRSTALRVVWGLMALGAAVLGAAWYYHSLEQRGRAETLLVNSTPDGAEVFIDGKRVGVTPLAVDNRWSGQPQVELRLNGYQSARAQFSGQQAQTISIQLRRAKK